MILIEAQACYRDFTVYHYISEIFVCVWFDFCLIWFFTSHQQSSFSYVGMGHPGLNQYSQDECVLLKDAHSEAWTHGPSVSSQALYHLATAVPICLCCCFASQSTIFEVMICCLPRLNLSTARLHYNIMFRVFWFPVRAIMQFHCMDKNNMDNKGK